MQAAVFLYLLIAITHVFPLWAIMCAIINASPFPYLPRKLQPSIRRERQIIFPRLDRVFHVNDPAMRTYVGKYALVACGFHILSVVIFALALHNDVPLPYVPKFSTLLPEGVFGVYTKFSLICVSVQALPIITLLYALYNKKHLPYMPPYVEDPELTKAELTRLERQAEPFGTIRLSRFENLRKTLVFAKCKDNRSNNVFKLALCEEKDIFENTECFLVEGDSDDLKKIFPPPFYVEDLLKTFDIVKE